jgi:colanic acid/amylovoran biosynthesis glycosyltransferase
MNSSQPVVFCTYDSPLSLGGPFTWLRNLLPALRKDGIDCRVLALTHFGGTGPLIEALRRDGFTVEAIDCHPSMKNQVEWILSQVHNDPPKVFVPNLVTSALFAARWLRESGSSTIGVLHSDDEYYRAITQEFVLGTPQYRLTDIVTVSEKLQRDTVNLLGNRNVFSTYIPYGVTPPNEKHRGGGHIFKIAYVGRLSEEQKRITLVTRSLIAASKTLPNTEAIIYGNGPDRQKVVDLIENADAGSKVKLAGAIPTEQILESLLDIDAIILLSDYEGLPIALLEGMSAGCVAICRNMNSGIPQLITHKKTGLLVSENVNDFVDAVKWLQADQNRCKTIAENGRSMILQQYSHATSVNRWSTLLSKRMESPPPRPFPMPRQIKLPPPRHELETAESRIPPKSQLNKSLQRLRIQLGAARRKLFGR